MTTEQDWVEQLNREAASQEDDFLEFWAADEQKRTQPRTVRILGADVRIPADVPLRLAALAQAFDGSESVDELRQVVLELFGEDHLDTWIANGLTTGMTKVIIAWGILNGGGMPTTFAEAVERSAEMEMAAAAGKAPAGRSRAARSASSDTQTSGKTGRSSSRTSGASTGSRRKTSQR